MKRILPKIMINVASTQTLNCTFKKNFHNMVSVQEAKDLIVGHVSPGSTKKISLLESVGYAISEPISAPLSIPPFRQSAMDGYAIRYADFDKFEAFELVGEIQAGSTEKCELLPGQTMRIFTGAPVPDHAGMVIMQEKAQVNGNGVSFTEDSARENLNIRNIGEQIKSGNEALPAHHLINDRSVGLLASLGLTEVWVFDKPKIGLLITGDELKKPGSELAFGQIYESNGDMLNASLRQFGFEIAIVKNATDNLEETQSVLEDIMKQVDVVITSGGISVGKYDFIKEASSAIGFEEVFYKVRQKPGKPLYFAKNNHKYLFALPGNPASLLVCFYFYVLPALRIMAGHKYPFIPEQKATLRHDYFKKGPRSVFLKAFAENSMVSLQKMQSSFDMLAFAHSNCMVYLPEEEKSYQEGDQVSLFELPQ